MCSIFCNLSYHIRQHDLLNVNVWATHGVRLWVLVWLCVPFIFVKWKCDISRYSDHRIYTTLHVTTFLFIFHQISPRLRLDPVASWKPITSEVPWREEFFWSRMKFREKVGTYLVVSWFYSRIFPNKNHQFGGIPIGGNHHLEHGKHLGNLVET